MNKYKLSKKRYFARQRRNPPGDILQYIQHFSKELHGHLYFKLIARVSSVAQARDGSLSSQIYRLNKFVIEKNLLTFPDIIFIVKSSIWTGARKDLAEQRFQTNSELYPDPKYYKPHYRQLELIVWAMKDFPTSENTAFLFESTDRAIRSDDYSFEDKDSPITEDELKVFAKIMHPFPVITICHPLATFAEIDSWRKTYGESSCRPNKSVGWRLRRKDKYHDEVIRLKFDEGLSYQQVFEKLEREVKKSCIELWCQKYRKEHQ